MKKVMFFGLMVMVSMMVFGFGISAAEEKVVSDNMVASVAQERPAAEQTGVETDSMILAYDGDICEYLEAQCGPMSPWVPVGYCELFYLCSECPDSPNCNEP